MSEINLSDLPKTEIVDVHIASPGARVAAYLLNNLFTFLGYTDLMVDGAPSPHQSDTTLRWLIDRLRS